MIIKGIKAFVIDYLSRHRNNVDRVLHIIGVPLAFYGVFLLFTGRWKMGLIDLFIGYLLQYIGHTYFEKNEVGEWILIKKIIKKQEEGNKMSIEIKRKHSLRFDRWAHSYDKSVLQNLVFNTSHNMFFREMKPFMSQGVNILDVGCGTGKFAHKLRHVSRDVGICGVDISKDMIMKAQEKLKSDHIDFRIGDVENLPYESNTFDMITCSNSFHHYPNQKRAVLEMHRVLKSDGKLMVIDGSPEGFWGKIIFGTIVEFVEGHVYHMFKDELRDIFFSSGFEKVVQKRFNPIAPLLFTLGHAKKEDGR